MAERLGDLSIAKVAWRSLRQQPLRALFSALTVALGVGMVGAATMVGDGLENLIQLDESVVEFMTMLLEIIFGVIGVMILAAAGFLIFNAFAMSVTQRSRQIGMLRALGASGRQVRRMLLAEAAIIGGAGALMGLLVGPILGRVLLQVMQYYGAQVGDGRLDWIAAIVSGIVGVLISVLSVLVPVRRATRIAPLAVVRSDQPEGAWSPPRRWVVVGALITISLWVYLAVWPPGAWSGHHQPWDLILPVALFVPWLIGLALMLPGMIGLYRRLARLVLQGSMGAIGRLTADNLGRERMRVTLTVITFAMGIAMMVGLNGILAYTNGVLVGRLAEDALRTDQAWFIYPFDRGSGLAQFEHLASGTGTMLKPEVRAEVWQRFEGRAGVGDVYNVFIPALSLPMPGFPSVIESVEMLQRPGAFTFTEGDWETAAPIMQAGCGVLLPPTIALNMQVGVGDSVLLENADYAVDCTVAGIGMGGMLPMPYLSLPARELFGVDENPGVVTVWPFEGADIRALQAELEALVAEFEGDAFLSTPEGELRAVLDVSDQLEGITYGLLILAVGAAALGMVNTTMMSVLQRLPEFGVLRGVGASRGQTLRIIIGEAALTGLLGGALGLLAGLGMTAINAVSYGGLRFSLLDLDLWGAAWETIAVVLPAGLWGVLVAPLIGALTAFFPARSLLKGKPVEILREMEE